MKKIILIILLISLLLFAIGCQSPIKSCHQETKYKTLNADNCQYTTGCSCVSKSWGGLGNCNSCQCEYQEEVCE